NDLIPIYKMNIDPEDYHINTEAIIKKDSIYKLIENGEPHHCVDLVLLGEGYTAGEIEKFKSDLRKYSNILFSIEPFKSNSSKFNITGILSFSMQSGADEPTFGKYKNTVLNATFNSLDSPRYLLTADNKKIRNIASQAPYDLAYIMVNIERYGGGGIYNTLGLFTASEVKWNDYVFLHEFGHFFAGLGDEYYTSSVAYDEFYPRGVEPLEANLTALLDPDNVKWKSCLSPGIKVPTEWGKAKFDSMHTTIDKLTSKRNELIDSLKNCRAPQSEISRYTNTYNDRINDIRGQIDDFISNHPLRGKIGVFEGAGYSAEGLYRPTVNSIMHKFDEKDRSYYKVNEAHLQKMINYYCK
ncbi:MAG: M64 family metallopeptidase, partial [Calditrichaceae bacterium]